MYSIFQNTPFTNNNDFVQKLKYIGIVRNQYTIFFSMNASIACLLENWSSRIRPAIWNIECTTSIMAKK